MNNHPTLEISLNEIDQLTTLIQSKYNYDFTNYALSSFKRRIERYLNIAKLTSVNALIDFISSSEENFSDFLKELTVNVTEMFRDPSMWTFFLEEILPQLSNSSTNLNIWHAGCSSGEEVYSLGIILKELNILQNTNITASDIDNSILSKAKKAEYPIKSFELNNNNFKEINSRFDLEKHIEKHESFYSIESGVTDSVQFIEHNLVSDSLEEQFDLIFCRNVLIYFNQPLQDKVLEKLHKALKPNGLLIIGSKESIAWCSTFPKFETVSLEEKVFVKKD